MNCLDASRDANGRGISEHLVAFEDSCNVYLVRDGNAGLLIDAGSGAAADAAGEHGVVSLDWVLHTHFHRDQCWGTPRLVERYALRVAVPEHERYLFESAREHWRTRRVYDRYNNRNLYLAPGEDIAVDAELRDYEPFEWRGISFHVEPAQGHTMGSVALLAEIDGQRVAFTGDLIAAGGHAYQLHALEYAYTEMSGVLFTLQSLAALRRLQPDLILPSHGPPITDVLGEIDLLEERLLDLARLGPLFGVFGFELPMPDPPAAEPPLIELSEHLLWSGPFACSNFYVLLSGSGEALLVDYGQPHFANMHIGWDQVPFESMRFIAHRLDQLRERFGVREIEVVCATHTHDDHVCGIPYLQRHHGSACWALDIVAEVIEAPAEWAKLPCSYPKPIVVERRLADGESIGWRGFELTFHHAPGHAERHSLISTEVDGRVVVFSGDNYFTDVISGLSTAAPELVHHTVFGNGFRPEMYARSLAALARIEPDLICPGHGEVVPFDAATRAQLEGYVERAVSAIEGAAANPVISSVDVSWVGLRPYLSTIAPGANVEYTLALRNNLGRAAEFGARLIAPSGWEAAAEIQKLGLEPGERGELVLSLRGAPSDAIGSRTLVTAEILIDGRSLGPVAEALVSVAGGNV